MATCVNCSQKIRKAPASSENYWIGQTDKKGTCYAGATQVASGEWVSEQEHWSEEELRSAQ